MFADIMIKDLFLFHITLTKSLRGNDSPDFTNEIQRGSVLKALFSGEAKTGTQTVRSEIRVCPPSSRSLTTNHTLSIHVNPGSSGDQKGSKVTHLLKIFKS